MMKEQRVIAGGRLDDPWSKSGRIGKFDPMNVQYDERCKVIAGTVP